MQAEKKVDHTLEESPEFIAPALSQAEAMQRLMSNPADAVEIGKQLPALQRARIAQFCYGRVHMRELGLRLASTCDLMTLKAAFGRGGEVVFKQSRDVDETLGALKNAPGSQSARPITLQGTIKS